MSRGARLRAKLRLSPTSWGKLVGPDYKAWIESRFEGSSDLSRKWLTVFERQTTEGTVEMRAEPYQREAILRIIYMLEFGSKYASDDHLPMNQIAVQMATGSGKTCVMTHVVSWAKACERGAGAEIFIILAPNTIVRQRLWEGLSAGSNPFGRIGFPNPPIHVLNLAQSEFTSLDHFDVILSNIHRLFETNHRGTQIREFLAQTGRRFIVINDESHNSVTSEYDRVMELFAGLPDSFVARIDLTATPKRTDLREIPSHFVFDYPAINGIEGRGTHSVQVLTGQRRFDADSKSWEREGGRQILKRPAVVRPIPEEVQFELKGSRKAVKITGEELCLLLSRDPEHVEKAKKVREKHGLPDSVQKSAIASSRPFKDALLTKSVELLKRCRSNSPAGKNPYTPILFAIAMNRREADECVAILKEKGLKALLVIGKDTKTEDANDAADTDIMVSKDPETGDIIPRDAMRELVNKLGRPGQKLVFEGIEYSCDYDAVVSVFMLKEGWDVACVEVMALLRPFESRLFAEQTIGRGLRIRRDLIDHHHLQELFVVEPPNWGLDEIWTDLGAEVQGTDGFRCRKIIATLVSSKSEKEVGLAVEELIGQMDDAKLRETLGSRSSERVKLLEVVFEDKRTKMTAKEVLKHLRDEVSNHHDKGIETILCERVGDAELKEKLQVAVDGRDRESILRSIDDFLCPVDDDEVVRCRKELRTLMTLVPATKRDLDVADNVVAQLVGDFELGYFNDVFENLEVSDEWKIVGIRFREVEQAKGGRKVLEQWAAEFRDYVEARDDGQHFASLLKSLESWLHNLVSCLSEEIVKVRLAHLGVMSDCYEGISRGLRSIPGVRRCLDDGLWLSPTEANRFRSAWLSAVDRLVEKVSDWLDAKTHGTDGVQELPNGPEVPTGVYALNPYCRSLFEREYTQRGYERSFALMLDESGFFQTTDEELKAFNGMTVLAWTTSHGIRIPWSASRTYRPDFLVAVGDKSGAFKAHLLVEIKRDDQEHSREVELKGKAAKEFCLRFENMAYGVLISTEFPSGKKVA